MPSGLGIEIGIENQDLRLGLGIGKLGEGLDIRDLDCQLRLGVRIRDRE